MVNKYKEEFDVDIQRGTIWGNPYQGLKGDAISKFIPYFKEKLRNKEITLADLRSLSCKRIGCTCAPLPCHGDYIAYVVNKLCKTENVLDI
ncbi:hypothetical protein POP12_228 [Pectobacterium phage POP12]|nr:hypothetical protein POP12_228 [Pectobacterium phage POP12]